MNNDTSVWQADGSTVCKLRETGKMRRICGELVAEVENELYFKVTRAREPMFHNCTDSQEPADEVAARIVAFLNKDAVLPVKPFVIAVVEMEAELIMEVTSQNGKLQVFKEKGVYCVLKDGIAKHQGLTAEQVIHALSILMSPYYK